MHLCPRNPTLFISERKSHRWFLATKSRETGTGPGFCAWLWIFLGWEGGGGYMGGKEGGGKGREGGGCRFFVNRGGEGGG